MKRQLLTEQDVRLAAGQGKTRLVVPRATIVTPLASDAALEKKITIERTDSVPVVPLPAAGAVQAADMPSVAIGSDHGGFALKAELIFALDRREGRVAFGSKERWLNKAQDLTGCLWRSCQPLWYAFIVLVFVRRGDFFISDVLTGLVNQIVLYTFCFRPCLKSAFDQVVPTALLRLLFIFAGYNQVVFGPCQRDIEKAQIFVISSLLYLVGLLFIERARIALFSSP